MSGSGGGESGRNEATEQQEAIERLRAGLQDVAALARARGTRNGRARAREVRRREQRPIARRASEIEPRPVEWLWPGRIPFGKLALVAGDPGTGKSTLTLDLCARLSVARPWPDGQPGPAEPMASVILSAEDGAEDTVRPRLDSAGADCERVYVMHAVGVPRCDPETGEPLTDEGEEEVAITLPAHVPALEALVQETRARLVVIDPLNAYLSGEVNSWRDHDLRRALQPLAEMADRTGAAVIVVAHLNKAQAGQALYRVGGSIALVAAARMAHLVSDDPEDDTGARRVFAPLKSNLASRAESLLFVTEPALNGTARIRYVGITQQTAQSLLELAQEAPEEQSAVDEACDFLRAELHDRAQPARDVQARARQAGIALKTLERARHRLGVVAQQQHETLPGQGARITGWFWRLPGSASRGTTTTTSTGQARAAAQPEEQPPADAQDAKNANAPIYGDLGSLGSLGVVGEMQHVSQASNNAKDAKDAKNTIYTSAGDLESVALKVLCEQCRAPVQPEPHARQDRLPGVWVYRCASCGHAGVISPDEAT